MSSKQCPKCQSVNLVLIGSQFHKICNNCNEKIYWPLDDGQKPLIANNRMKSHEKM